GRRPPRDRTASPEQVGRDLRAGRDADALVLEKAREAAEERPVLLVREPAEPELEERPVGPEPHDEEREQAEHARLADAARHDRDRRALAPQEPRDPPELDGARPRERGDLARERRVRLAVDPGDDDAIALRLRALGHVE